MKTVFKYEFKFDDYFDVGLPINAEVLTCAKQGGKWFMWALVDTETMLTETRQFRLSGTGHDLSMGFSDDEHRTYYYITTYFEHRNGTEYLWHIFEINPPNSKNIMTDEEKNRLMDALGNSPIDNVDYTGKADKS